MAHIHNLLKQVQDPALQAELEKEIDILSSRKKFGLVFEDHKPECTPLYDVPVKCGTTVARNKPGKLDETYSVLKIEGDTAVCCKQTDKTVEEIPVVDLIAVAKFGAPIYPYLKPVDSVCNAPDSDLWHTLIEADNYHALQLLKYLYAGKVDCIYIDPPYNSGATDWKYNNKYIEDSDEFRHSKWLSMMKKRLLLAKDLLKKDGTLITTIDDNEFSRLWMLLQDPDLFPDRSHIPVTIQHNPGGTQGKKFSVTHEYAIYSISPETEIFRKKHIGGDTYNLRRWGSTSNRYEGATCFYPVLINAENNIVGFGDVLDDAIHPSAEVELLENGLRAIWPIDKNGTEKKWRYARDTVEGIFDRLFVVENKDRIEIMIRRESEPPKTVWTDSLYNAEEFGTKLISKITNTTFPFPKSIYAERDSIAYAVAEKPDALIIDFFAGSGTTLNAVNLLNAEDGGNRRCIIVTNNECSKEEADQLKAKGYKNGDEEWEKHGICKSVTWPRTKYSILGHRDDNTILEGDYFTNITVDVEKQRRFTQIGFIKNVNEMKLTEKKQLVSLFGKGILPQRLVENDSKFIVSDDEKHTISVLFDDSAVEEWLEALVGMDHITDFYIVTAKRTSFNKIKDRANELLGPIIVQEQVKRPMSEGFATNCEYFKLGFLDKKRVSLGMQFREILPLLWLRAGAKGKRPEIEGEDIPEMLILPKNGFAVLTEETLYSIFAKKLAETDGVETVFFVTNSDSAFHEMSDGIKQDDTYQLYKDYLENFMIGARRALQ